MHTVVLVSCVCCATKCLGADIINMPCHAFAVSEASYAITQKQNILCTLPSELLRRPLLPGRNMANELR